MQIGAPWNGMGGEKVGIAVHSTQMAVRRAEEEAIVDSNYMNDQVRTMTLVLLCRSCIQVKQQPRGKRTDSLQMPLFSLGANFR